MGRRKKSSKGDLIVGIVVLTAIPFITHPEATKSFFTTVFQVAILVFIIAAMVYFVFKKKAPATSSLPLRNPRKDPKLGKLNSNFDSVGVNASGFDTRLELELKEPIKQPDSEWSLELINSLEWKKFEELCAGYFAEKGYRAEVSRQGADGGIDVFLYKASYSPTKAFGIVQCKAWNTYKVGVKPIRELFGVMAAEKAPLGIFVTSGTYTREAESFSKGKSLKLLTGKSLLELLKSLPVDKQQTLLKKITTGDYITPSCPSCGVKMTKRKSKRAGNEFWGCVHYPRCKNTLRLKWASNS